MESEHRIYPEHSIGVGWLRGRVTAESFVSALRKLYADPAWRPGFCTLWDAREITEMLIVPADIPVIGQDSLTYSALRGTGKVAMVVGRQLDYDILQLLIIRRQSQVRPVRLFWTIRDALEWLDRDIPPDVFIKRGPVRKGPGL
jgi:hypothetical protein